MKRLLIIALFSFSAFANQQIQMKEMDINAFVDDELIKIREEHDKAKFYLKTSQKKNQLLEKNIDIVKKLHPERIESAKKYKKYSKINDVASAYLECIKVNENEEDCSDAKTEFESVAGKPVVKIYPSPQLLRKFTSLKNITLESFPDFQANIYLTIRFDNQGNSRFVQINYGKSQYSKHLEKFDEAVEIFANKFGFIGPKNSTVDQLVRF